MPPLYVDSSMFRKIQEDPTEVEKPTTSIRMVEHTVSRRNVRDHASYRTGICSPLLAHIVFNLIISLLLLRITSTIVSFSQQMAQDT